MTRIHFKAIAEALARIPKTQRNTMKESDVLRAVINAMYQFNGNIDRNRFEEYYRECRR
jgi:ribosomal protein L19E